MERAKRKRDKSIASIACVWVVAQEPIFGYCRQRAGNKKKKRTGGRERTANLPEDSTTLNRLRRADTPMNKTNKANTTTNTFADDNRSSTTPIMKQDKFHTTVSFCSLKLFPKKLTALISLLSSLFTDKFQAIVKSRSNRRKKKKKRRMLNYTKASINKANNSRHFLLLPVLFAYVFQLAISFGSETLPSHTYLPPLAWAYFSPDLFLSFCLVLQKPVAVQNTLLLCCCFYQCAADAATVRFSYGARRPFLFPSARGRNELKTLYKSVGRVIFFVVVIPPFFFLGKRRILNAIFFFLPAHNLACIALQTGHGDGASLPISRPDRLCRVRHQAFATWEKMRRNKIRRRFNVINHTG